MLTVNCDTQQKYDKVTMRSKQHVEVPVRYVEDVKISGGRHRVITREVTVLGTVEVEHYGTRRVEYGKCHINNHVVCVVEDGGFWKAVDRKPVQACIA
jgi:hypothetical protein